MPYLTKDNNPTDVFDKHYSLKCPHCGIHSNISAVSIPRYERIVRFRPKKIGLAYRCDACNAPVFLRFSVQLDLGNHRALINESYEEIERAEETFEFKYLPTDVTNDFREALICYSSSAFNGFAAMCRRTVQTVSTDFGARGGDKVLKQLKEMKEMAQLDDEIFGVLTQIVIDGHDGAHPHLPRLDETRAAVLLELMKDVLYQLYIRKGKLEEAKGLRQHSIQNQ